MRKFSIFMGIEALLVSVAPVLTGQSAEDEAAIKKVVEQLYAALNKKDIKAAFA